MNNDKIELIYDLFSLPTAQHKAGLAGLLVLVESMKRRGLGFLPTVAVSDATTVNVSFSLDSLQSVLNDLYNATTEEIPLDKIRKNKKKEEVKPLRVEKKRVIDKKSGKEKEVPIYIYPQVVPLAAFLKSFQIPDVWVKLWRDTIWATLRGIPTTRIPYEQRAEGQPVEEAKHVWNDLLKWNNARRKNNLYTAEVASSIFVGAQAVNAEKVPFLGSPDENLLLHFWPVVMTCWVPEVIDREGKTKQAGFVLAIPEVSSLHEFVSEFPETLATLNSATAGFRPKHALISLPQEGALEYIHYLLAVTKMKMLGTEISRYSVSSVEVYHLEKRGNNIHMWASERVSLNDILLQRYETIRGVYSHPIFKARLIRNLLHKDEWHMGFDRQFSSLPAEIFVLSDKSGYLTDQFCRDVRTRFNSEIQDHQRRKEHIMEANSIPPASLLAERVHAMIRTYVTRKTENKSGIDWKTFETSKDKKAENGTAHKYREARQKVCTDAFLAIRGRRSREDFVSYFTGTICSVPQYLPDSEFGPVAEALMNDKWEEVKTLAMLALSAHSNI